jgi:hypothetical protein
MICRMDDDRRETAQLLDNVPGIVEGIKVGNAAGTITNAGTIQGALGIGVYFGGNFNDTLTNSGTIISFPGVDAVLFKGSGADRVIVDPRAVFIGSVVGYSNGNNTLELASAASAGTLSGLGSKYQNFGAVAVDSRAQWTITGSNSLASGATLADAGTATIMGTLANSGTVLLGGSASSPALLIDSGMLAGAVGFAPGAGNYSTLRLTNTLSLPGTIGGFTGPNDIVDLTQLSDAGNDAFTTFNIATNVLTVTGDNGAVALQLDAENYTGVGWSVSSDGSGGADIIPVVATPPGVSEALVDNTGSSSGQLITSDPTLTGGGAPDATVTISEGGNTLGTTTANNAGAWSFTPIGLADGAHTLVASETNTGGTGTASLTFALDTMPPVVAISSAGGLTNQAMQTITGTIADAFLAADPTITLFDNGTEIGTTTASGGNWSASIALPQTGTNTITAQATDLAENTGTSATDALTLDTALPTLVKNEPVLLPDGDTATIPESLLQFADAQSSDAQETYTVTSAPQDGKLLLNGAPTSSFTQAEIDNGLVSYEETAGPGVTSDSFGFTVSDAAGNMTGPQQFQFILATDLTGIHAEATTEGGQSGFFEPPGVPLNVVYTPDRNNLPSPVSGDFNLEVITVPTQASYPVPSGFQGVAVFTGGTGKTLTLLAGNINVSDSGPADSIVGGPGFSTIGGGQRDTIVGGSNNEFIDGTQGYESITGGSAGDETIFGGSFDTVAAGAAAAVAIGGVPFDTLIGGTGTDFLDGSRGSQSIIGGSAGNETIYSAASDTVNGGGAANETIGGVAGNTISGGTGTEFIDGSGGNQLITVGSAGSETIWGGNGDTITGGAAEGLIGFVTTPGAGAEFFSEKGNLSPGSTNTVGGFSQAAGDLILLNSASSASTVVASAQTASGNTTITFGDGSKLTLLGIASVNTSFFG